MKPKIIKREIKITGHLSCEGQLHLSNGSIVQFSADEEFGIQQWGASKDELWITLPVVEKYWQKLLNQI
ncbi:MAG: hypothetical protein GX372_03535 [Ignavibacteria bacterium]|jgi:hypothetical protein|nr:hypothetical protein [Ignavibacteria bacterium]